MTTILLTGATGFIGSHFLRRAAGRARFRCLVRPGSIKKILNNEFVQVIEGDLLSKNSIRKAIEGANIVLHLGALIRKSKPEDIYRVNVEGTRFLVSQASEQGVSRFIFVSTENALREDLNDAYADSKRQAESLVRTFQNFLILRPCFVYGRGDDHGLGQLIELVGKFPVLPLFGGLTSKTQPLYIEDMVEYLLRAIEKPIQGEYLLAGPDEISLNDFLKESCRDRKRKPFFLTLPRLLLKYMASLGDLLPRSFGWGTNQFKNIYYSRTYSTDKTVRDFGYAPRSAKEGLATWLGANKSLQESASE